MKFVEPKVFIIAHTQLLEHNYNMFLDEVDPDRNYVSNAPSDTEELIETSGRMCYRSFAPGLNKNVTKVREGNNRYISNILEQKHGSVLEHATATVAFLNVSRVFTHEIVRHRAGTAFSQESLRYVRLDDLKAFLPTCFGNDSAEEFMENIFKYLENGQTQLAEHFDLDSEKDFNRKKQITSAMRRLAPIGLDTSIIVTANHRAWRHIIEQRVQPHAEEEIRLVMAQVAQQFKLMFPNLYQDMDIGPAGVDNLPMVIFQNSKV